MYQLVRHRELPYILITIIIGISAHFMYEFSGYNPVTALIAPVNESVWEHLKLLFFPFLLASVTEYFLRRPAPAAFFAARFAGVWTGMLAIIFLYYGYSGILGKNYAPVDILLFFTGIITAYCVSSKYGKKLRRRESITIFLYWTFTVLLFFIFTCFPPELPLFLPPV